MQRPRHPHQVLCDWCGAGPGQQCTRKGRPYHHYHQARFDLLNLLK